MSTLDALTAQLPESQRPDVPVHTREGLALLLLDRIAKEEGYQTSDARRYLLDLLREILLTIDGKRTPPIVISTVERRAGPIDRRESSAQ